MITSPRSLARLEQTVRSRVWATLDPAALALTRDQITAYKNSFPLITDLISDQEKTSRYLIGLLSLYLRPLSPARAQELLYFHLVPPLSDSQAQQILTALTAQH